MEEMTRAHVTHVHTTLQLCRWRRNLAARSMALSPSFSAEYERHPSVYWMKSCHMPS
jgi:hypothetical protein|eukprot:COSAG01_NODE_39626_length_474_cov_0.818667_1_plen_57_part_00